MAISKDDILSAIEEMSVMDLVELISAIEEKFGVTAAAAVAAAPAAAGGDAGAIQWDFDLSKTASRGMWRVVLEVELGAPPDDDPEFPRVPTRWLLRESRLCSQKDALECVQYRGDPDGRSWLRVSGD